MFNREKELHVLSLLGAFGEVLEIQILVNGRLEKGTLPFPAQEGLSRKETHNRPAIANVLLVLFQRFEDVRDVLKDFELVWPFVHEGLVQKQLDEEKCVLVQIPSMKGERFLKRGDQVLLLVSDSVVELMVLYRGVEQRPWLFLFEKVRETDVFSVLDELLA